MSNDQMKDDSMTPSDLNVCDLCGGLTSSDNTGIARKVCYGHPPLTPKESLTTEVEEIRKGLIGEDERIILDDNTEGHVHLLFSIVEDLMKENAELKNGNSFDTVQKLHSRLDELMQENEHAYQIGLSIQLRENVEEAAEAGLARFGNELFKVKEERDRFAKLYDEACAEKAWGCGHVNQGSCSQCLGHVTNERNALRSKLEALAAALGKKEG